MLTVGGGRWVAWNGCDWVVFGEFVRKRFGSGGFGCRILGLIHAGMYKQFAIKLLTRKKFGFFVF